MRWLSLLLAGLFLFAACSTEEDTAPAKEDVKKAKLDTGKGRRKRKDRPRKKRDKAAKEEPKEGYLRVLAPEEIQQILDEYELYFVPTANPDGVAHVFCCSQFWRLNRRPNGGTNFGVDLNRNFAFLWGRREGGWDPPQPA